MKRLFISNYLSLNFLLYFLAFLLPIMEYSIRFMLAFVLFCRVTTEESTAASGEETTVVPPGKTLNQSILINFTRKSG